MTEILSQIQSYIILYAPTVFTAVYALVNWLSTVKKLNTINVKQDVEESLKTTRNDIDALVDMNKMLIQENALLREQQKKILEALTKIEVKDEE